MFQFCKFLRILIVGLALGVFIYCVYVLLSLVTLGASFFNCCSGIFLNAFLTSEVLMLTDRECYYTSSFVFHFSPCLYMLQFSAGLFRRSLKFFTFSIMSGEVNVWFL